MHDWSENCRDAECVRVIKAGDAQYREGENTVDIEFVIAYKCKLNVEGCHQSMRMVQIGTWSMQGEDHCGRCQRFSSGQYRELLSADVKVKMNGSSQCREVNAGRCSIQSGQCNVVINIREWSTIYEDVKKKGVWPIQRSGQSREMVNVGRWSV